MIVDSSALLAVIFNEPEAQQFVRLLEQQPASIAAPTLLEASMVVDRAPRRELGRGLDKLAYATDEPLLFKGDNFNHTDIKPAVELDA